MYIKSNRQQSRDLDNAFKERQDVIDRYNNALAEYTKARKDYSKLCTQITKQVKKELADALTILPGVTITTKYDEKYNNFRVFMSYDSSKVLEQGGYRRRRTTQHRSYRGSYVGIKWRLDIYVDDSGFISKDPKIQSQLLNTSDYQTLANTAYFFKAVDILDWENILDSANESITAEYPGELDTTIEDAVVTIRLADKILGKDVWMRIGYLRGGSYPYWVKVLHKRTDTKYSCIQLVDYMLRGDTEEQIQEQINRNGNIVDLDFSRLRAKIPTDIISTQELLDMYSESNTEE